jgi:alpha-tubulin suppressor-like RCC1 family protein
MFIKNGFLYTFGAGGEGQLGDGSTITYRNVPYLVGGGFSQVTDISVGDLHSLFINNSIAYAMGKNSVSIFLT